MPLLQKDFAGWIPVFSAAARLKILPDESLSTTRGGLELPGQAREREKGTTGIVVAISPRRGEQNKLMPTVAVGDRVLYGQFIGADVEEMGEDGKKTMYKYLFEADVVAYIPLSRTTDAQTQEA